MLDLCLAPVLHLLLSLLISGVAEEVLRETTATLTWPACLGYFQLPPARPQDAAQRQKSESQEVKKRVKEKKKNVGRLLKNSQFGLFLFYNVYFLSFFKLNDK